VSDTTGDPMKNLSRQKNHMYNAFRAKLLVLTTNCPPPTIHSFNFSTPLFNATSPKFQFLKPLPLPLEKIHKLYG
jgi:hypothetical protein